MAKIKNLTTYRLKKMIKQEKAKIEQEKKEKFLKENADLIKIINALKIVKAKEKKNIREAQEIKKIKSLIKKKIKGRL